MLKAILLFIFIWFVYQFFKITKRLDKFSSNLTQKESKQNLDIKDGEFEDIE